MVEWRDVVGYESVYKVSNDGKLITNYKGEWRDRSINIDNHTGYPCATLYVNGKCKKRYIHRLVAEAFIDNPENKPEVDHINGNRADNRVENLRWVTRKENINNPITISRLRAAFTGFKSPHYGRKRSNETRIRISKSLKDSLNNKGKTGCLCPLSKPIYRYDLDGNYIDSFAGQSEAARITGVRQADISRVCLYKRKSAGGYIWRKFKVEHL